ncbi:sodium/proton antiporter NhaA [soil metagenome]
MIRATRTSIATTFQEFFQSSTSAGIVIVACTAFALAWINSPFSASYHALLATPLQITVDAFRLDFTIEHFVNDGLMVVFFLVVGLEIKRELLIGELSSRKKAMLPMIAAVSGMLVPGFIYAVFNIGTPAIRGWAVPVATDIAFALGILALLGKRVPLGLKIFLAALAIVDDLLSVVVIALFYTSTLHVASLLWAAVIVVILIIGNRSNVHSLLFYALAGIALWLCFLSSGVHPTISGVVLAICIPSRSRIDQRSFLQRTRELVNRIVAREEEQNDAIHALESLCEHVQSPLHRIEHSLQPWVSFGIMPLFAVVNAGVAFNSSVVTHLISPVSLGIILGLFLGKQLGVSFAVWLSVRLHWAELPANVTMRNIYGVSILCGIGFTMALFVAHLAFTSNEDLEVAKLSILVGSFISAIVGSTLLRSSLPKTLPT